MDLFKKVCDGVYYMPHNGYSDRPAIGLVVGNESALLFDSGNSYKHAEDILKAAKEITDMPITYTVLSHWHWDHVFGAHYINSPVLISHPLAARQLEKIKDYNWDDTSLDLRVQEGLEIEFCSTHIKKELSPNERSTVKVAIPNMCFEGKINIDLGDILVEIFHLGGEHCEDSICLYVDRKVLFLGDGLCQEMFKGPWSYDLNDFNKRLDIIEKYDCETYINSHWDVQNKAKFTEFCKEIINAGEVVGKSMSITEAETNYNKQFASSPTDYEKELLQSFVEGNIKNIKQ